MLRYKQFVQYFTEETLLERASPSNVMQHETAAIDSINSQIEKNKGKNDHIKVKIGNTIHKITHAEKVPGTPKADFLLHDKGGNHIYLSHKAGSSVRDFQQFGGTTEHADHPAVKKLVSHIKKKYGGDGKSMPGTVATKLDRSNPEDENLLHKSAFGNNYGSKKRGINNVHAIVQGEVSLQKGKHDHYEIKANNIYKNGKLPSKVQGMVSARYMNKRKNHGLNNIRTGVLPQGSRTVAEHI
jgi:hypothetical protein